MSNTMSPYEPPQLEKDSGNVMPASVSSVPKVFGILHLVLGGIGIVFGLVTVAGVVFKDKFEKMQSSSYPEETRESMREAMQPLYATQGWDIATAIGSLILAILLVIAGVNLLKYRAKGLRVSNIYSGLSILHKLFVLVIVLLIKGPAMKEFARSLDKIGGQPNVDMSAMMGPVVTITGVAMALLMMIYPILSYVLLNKKQAKESLS